MDCKKACDCSNFTAINDMRFCVNESNRFSLGYDLECNNFVRKKAPVTIGTYLEEKRLLDTPSLTYVGEDYELD
jgi:hypothetical protein